MDEYYQFQGSAEGSESDPLNSSDVGHLAGVIALPFTKDLCQWLPVARGRSRPESAIGARSLSGRFRSVTAGRKRPKSGGKQWLKSGRRTFKQISFRPYGCAQSLSLSADAIF